MALMIGVACRDGPGLPAGTVNDKEKKLIADMLPDLKAQVRPRSLPQRHSSPFTCFRSCCGNSIGCSAARL